VCSVRKRRTWCEFATFVFRTDKNHNRCYIRLQSVLSLQLRADDLRALLPSLSAAIAMVQEAVARITIGGNHACRRPRLFYSVLGLVPTFPCRPEEEISQRCASTNPVVAHDEQLGITSLHRFPIELQGPPIKPSRPWFHVVFEGKPKVGELLNLPVV